MTRVVLNNGTGPNTGTGAPLRTLLGQINGMTDEIYAGLDATNAALAAALAGLDTYVPPVIGGGGGGTVTPPASGGFPAGTGPRDALGNAFTFMAGGNDLSMGNGGGDTGDPNGRQAGRWGQSHPSIQPYFNASGFGAMRLPFLWERVQPVRNGPLGGATVDNKTEWQIVREVLVRNCAAGIKTWLEPHNYNRRFEAGVEKVIGVNFAKADFFDLWMRILADVASIPNSHLICVNMMNEPVEYGNGRGANLPVAEWFDTAQGLTTVIRNGGYGNYLAIPGTGFTHAYNWKDWGNGAAFANLVDPAKNWGPDVHEYFNQGRSGAGPGSAAAVAGSGAQSFIQIRDWCEEQTSLKGYKIPFGVGENSFAGRNGSQSATPSDGDNTNAIQEATIALAFLQANRLGGPRSGGGTCGWYFYWKFNQRSADIGNADDVNDADPPGGYLGSYPIGSYGPQMTLIRQQFQLA